MKDLLLIIISLLIGFSYGIKSKQKKLKTEVEELKRENYKQKEQIDNLLRNERLRQYTAHNDELFGRERFETDFVKFITENEDNRIVAIETSTLLKYLSEKDDRFAEMNINTDVINKVVSRYMTDALNGTEIKSLNVRYDTFSRIVDVEFLYKVYKYFEEQMSLNMYAMTIRDLYQDMEYIIDNIR